MGYLHINNLYKDQTILIFKECYALEKIHGTSAHISWNAIEQKVKFFSGGESYERFVSLFDMEFLRAKLAELFVSSNATIYGEAYGGKHQGMSNTYGKDLKFIGFEVQVNEYWLNVPNAEEVCKSLNIEFVDYVRVSTDLDALNAERDKPSTQAKRNGIIEDRLREGVVLKPLLEFTTNNGGRVIAKHKRDEFKETKTPREVSPEAFKIIEDAKAIAEEWVTEMRLKHVLDKLPQGVNVESTKLVIAAMVEDVYREAKGEIVESKEVVRAISSKTAAIFKKKLQNEITPIPYTMMVTGKVNQQIKIEKMSDLKKELKEIFSEIPTDLAEEIATNAEYKIFKMGHDEKLSKTETHILIRSFIAGAKWCKATMFDINKLK